MKHNKLILDKTPLSIHDPNFGEHNFGYFDESDSFEDLKKLDRGTVLVPNPIPLVLIPVLRQTRLELLPVENPKEEFEAIVEYLTFTSPKTNEKRLEFIQELRGHYYKDIAISHLSHIGDDGMGFEWDGEKWLEMPQRGKVKLGDNVRIGAFTTVKNGTLEDKYTEIGDGCKIGSHCNIGHNVILGKHCLLTHRVSIAGSAVIGERVFFGQGSIVKNKVTIGDGAYIGQGANVINNIPAGAIVVGNPARIIAYKNEPR